MQIKIVQAQGQMCNQFWIYSPYLVDAIEKKSYFVILVPDASFEYFINLQESKFISFPFYSKRLSSILGHNQYVKLLKFIINSKLITILKKLSLKSFGYQFITPSMNFDTREPKAMSQFRKLNNVLEIIKPNDAICSDDADD
jgi:hypothetical protein